MSPSVALADPRLGVLRETSRFRELIREHTRESKASIAPEGEPGEPLRLTGTVVAADGAPIADGMVYAYQTDVRGYDFANPDSDRAPPNFARLFAYARTDHEGRFEFLTIRPASYPGRHVAQHIHYIVSAEGFEQLIGEVLFEDDPKVDLRNRRAATSRDWPIVLPVADGEGVLQASVTLTLRRRR